MKVYVEYICGKRKIYTRMKAVSIYLYILNEADGKCQYIPNEQFFLYVLSHSSTFRCRNAVAEYIRWPWLYEQFHLAAHIHNFYQKIPPDYILPLPHSVPNRILCMDDGIYPLRSFSTAGEKLGEKEYKKIYSQFGWLESFEIFVFRFYFSFDTFSLCRVVRSKYRSQNGEIRWSLLQSSCAISFQLYILAVFGACTNPILFISSFGAVWLAAYSHLGIGIVFFARLFDGI